MKRTSRSSARRFGADVDSVPQGHGRRQPASANPFLFPGVGLRRGRAFPKDVKALVATRARPGQSSSTLLRAGGSARNERQKRSMLDKAKKHFNGRARRPLVRHLGAGPSSRRPTTCARRLRLVIIEGLLGKGARVKAPRPGSPRAVAPTPLSRSHLVRADAVRRAGGCRRPLHRPRSGTTFRHPDFERMKATMKSPVGCSTAAKRARPRRGMARAGVHLLRSRPLTPGSGGPPSDAPLPLAAAQGAAPPPMDQERRAAGAAAVREGHLPREAAAQVGARRGRLFAAGERRLPHQRLVRIATKTGSTPRSG